MAEQGRTAYVTGGASGIGKAAVEMLVERGAKVFIADQNISAAESLAVSLNQKSKAVYSHEVDLTSWEQQLESFEAAVAQFGRIDYVLPVAGIAEGKWLQNPGPTTGFQKPDLGVLDLDLTAVFYTVALAIQQFRRQEKADGGFRGKLLCVSSVCGLYAVATMPVYTAAKHGVVGLVRSYGKFLPEEGITMNAICPNITRTNLAPQSLFDAVEEQKALTPMAGVLEAFSAMLDPSNISGEIFEAGPNGGYARREGVEYLDAESKRGAEMLNDFYIPWQRASQEACI
ncbi:NAD(P)-binding protein [Neofusicoccum parvum]|nr:NAD(P)-binding protein [Neofusicoccum parvum]